MGLVNIYCDESCHLQRDKEEIMAFGAFFCPINEFQSLKENVTYLKGKHGLTPDYEIKWNKVSNSKVKFFMEIVDYFFSNENLGFRALIVPEKADLEHTRSESSHSEFYYKMYFVLLRQIFSEDKEARVYLDKRDTVGGGRTKKLHEVLCNYGNDLEKEKLTRVQIADSKKMLGIQIADFFLGAVAYANRGLTSSEAKNKIVKHIRNISEKNLISPTLINELKINVAIWEMS